MMADSYGSGTKPVHVASRPGVGLGSGAPCRPCGRCEKGYDAAPLDRGHASRPEGAMMEPLGKVDN